MFKYETHMHTSEASACGSSTGAEMADKYKAEGYTGIIVTDHFFNGNCAVPYDLPWDKRVELFCKGYENAKKRGDEIGLDVFFGFEFGNGGSDFLVYGLDKQWLIRNRHIADMDYVDFLEFARKCGGMVVQAHPFRDCDYIRCTIHAPHFVDGVEIWNASHTNPEFNKRAKMYAQWYDLPVTAGSDTHNTTDRWYGGGVLSEKRFENVLDYTRFMVRGELTLIEKG